MSLTALVIIAVSMFLGIAVFVPIAIASDFSYDEVVEKILATIVVVLLVGFVSSSALCIGYTIGQERIPISDETEINQFQLVQMGEDEDGYTYVYLDEDDESATDMADYDDSKLYYDTRDDNAYVAVRQITKYYYKQWWFIKSSKREEIAYEYDFHIPKQQFIMK